MRLYVLAGLAALTAFAQPASAEVKRIGSPAAAIARATVVLPPLGVSSSATPGKCMAGSVHPYYGSIHEPSSALASER